MVRKGLNSHKVYDTHIGKSKELSPEVKYLGFLKL